MNSFDVIVIGVGGWGSAALWQLARRGVKACGIEQFQTGHDRGSSHGESRIIRMAYFAHPDYVPLLRRAYALWRELEGESGAELMTLTGLLCIGEPGSALIRGLEECYAAHEIEHERLSPEEAMNRFRQFSLPEEAACYWDPHGGYLRPEACIRAHVDGAVHAGATLIEGEMVTAIRPGSGGEDVEVTTTQRTLRAQKVIVTTGAYANQLLADAGVSVQPTRKVLFWYEAEDPRAVAPGRFPCWIAQLKERNFYGFPTLDGIAIKAAEDTGGQPLDDPAQAYRELRPEDEAHLRPFLDQLFARRVGARLRHQTCLYEKSTDDHFIIDAHPEHENVIFAVGGSGHGFKFCSAIGELVADLATQAVAKGPALFRLSRFARGPAPR
jgi:sarcosine oxidase